MEEGSGRGNGDGKRKEKGRREKNSEHSRDSSVSVATVEKLPVCGGGGGLCLPVSCPALLCWPALVWPLFVVVAKEP